MGYKVAVLEPSTDCPAGHAADHLLCASYTDAAALAELGKQCVAVTTEFENVPAQSLSTLAVHSFVAPSADCVSVAQDRLVEKKFFTDCAQNSGVMPAPHHAITCLADIDSIDESLFPGILKTARLGYDGKGQVKVTSRIEAKAAFENLQGVVCVLEKMLPLAYEISVLAARGADGDAVVYPIAENVHRDGILFTTTVPGPNVTADCAARAQAAALEIIARLNYVGVLCIEFFVLKDGTLVVNEMAPRPHNSGHYTLDACDQSQFDLQVRTLAGLPLTQPCQHSAAIMLNLLGDVWLDANNTLRTPDWAAVLALPGTHLHLYGKTEARTARKMGHLNVTGTSPAHVREVALKAAAILGIDAF